MSYTKYTPEQHDVKDHVVSTDGILLVSAGAGTGKEQPLSSKIITPTGWTTIGKIKVGDKVCSPYNTINTVLAIHPQGIKDVYEINFSDGSKARCGLNHLWYVNSQNWRNKEYRAVSLKQLLKENLKNTKSYKFKVPLTNIATNYVELPLDPYLLGALIADGSFQTQVCLISYSEDKSIIDKCITLLPEGTKPAKIRYTSEKGLQQVFNHSVQKHGDHSLKRILKELNLHGTYSHERFIPDTYKFSSKLQRIDLLHGLMDSDGNVRTRNRVTYSTTSEKLAKDITELVQSLGGTATRHLYDKKDNRSCFTIIIRFNDFNPFSLKRKAIKVTPRKQNTVRKAIVSIEKLCYQEEQQCITVSGDNLYITDDYVTTHNSFMSERIADEINPSRGLYTAFNKAIVQEGKYRFRNTNVECKTLHALAYRYAKPKQDISDISYTCIKEKISYSAKYKVIQAINLFYVSASVDMFEFMESALDEVKLQELAIKYIEMMLEGTLAPTFNFMLKYFHLLLVEGTVKCKYDLVILDEINDTTAVALEIFKLIEAPKKLGLGEPSQAIYDFLNLVDGFEELEDAPVLNLTQSFRCSIDIAERIQSFMQKYTDKEFKFVGTDEPVKNDKVLYCTLTNAAIISKISHRLAQNKGFHLLRNISEIFSYPLAIVSTGQGKKVYQKKYKYLEEEYENYTKNRKPGDTYLSHLLACIDDQETKSAVNLLLTLNRKGVNIFNLYKMAKESKVDLSYVIATVFTSKGLEYETVYIADDLNARVGDIIDKGGVETHEDLVAMRCYYVACSRCGVNLNNANMLPVLTRK